jgi:RNA-directed DNA polymerase
MPHGVGSIRAIWTGVKWLIDVDVVGFFDNIDHDVLVSLLEKRIADRRFVRLIRGLLKAGYVEDWVFHKTYSGTPQGGVVSPMLANIYLHELDMFMQAKMAGFDKGKQRSPSLMPGASGTACPMSAAQWINFAPKGAATIPESLPSWKRSVGSRRNGLPFRPATPLIRTTGDCATADTPTTSSSASLVANRSTTNHGGGQDLPVRSPEVGRVRRESGIHKASDGARFLGYEVRTMTNPNPHKAIFDGRPAVRRGWPTG